MLTDTTWSVRVRAGDNDSAIVHAPSGTFSVGRQLSFDPSPPAGTPTALEMFLGALAADVLGGLRLAAARRRIALDDIELTLGCNLRNPLVFLGVVGEEGSCGIASVAGTVYVTTEDAAGDVEAAWAEALERSPLLCTVRCAAAVDLRLAFV